MTLVSTLIYFGFAFFTLLISSFAIFSAYMIYRQGFRVYKLQISGYDTIDELEGQITDLDVQSDIETVRTGIRQKKKIQRYVPKIEYTFKYDGVDYTVTNWLPEGIILVKRTQSQVNRLLSDYEEGQSITIKMPDDTPTKAHVFSTSSRHLSDGYGGGVLSKLLSVMIGVFGVLLMLLSGLVVYLA